MILKWSDITALITKWRKVLDICFHYHGFDKGRKTHHIHKLTLSDKRTILDTHFQNRWGDKQMRSPKDSQTRERGCPWGWSVPFFVWIYEQIFWKHGTGCRGNHEENKGDSEVGEGQEYQHLRFRGNSTDVKETLTFFMMEKQRWGLEEASLWCYWYVSMLRYCWEYL